MKTTLLAAAFALAATEVFAQAAFPPPPKVSPVAGAIDMRAGPNAPLPFLAH